MQSMIEKALETGFDAVRLKSNREARLFRFALYHRIRVEKIRGLLTISVSDRIVRLDRRQITIEAVEDWKRATESELNARREV